MLTTILTRRYKSAWHPNAQASVTRWDDGYNILYCTRGKYPIQKAEDFATLDELVRAFPLCGEPGWIPCE